MVRRKLQCVTGFTIPPTGGSPETPAARLLTWPQPVLPPRPDGSRPETVELLLKRILLGYSPGYECSADVARPARAWAKPRVRPEARLRRVLRPGQAPALQPGVRDAVPAGQGRQGAGRAG